MIKQYKQLQRMKQLRDSEEDIQYFRDKFQREIRRRLWPLISPGVSIKDVCTQLESRSRPGRVY